MAVVTEAIGGAADMDVEEADTEEIDAKTVSAR
jgi:hypothetical protein